MQNKCSNIEEFVLKVKIGSRKKLDMKICPLYDYAWPCRITDRSQVQMNFILNVYK